MGFKGQGGDAYGDGYRSGNVTGSLKPFYETYLEGLNATNPRSDMPDSPDRPDQSSQPAQQNRFEDFDYAAYGQGGFGLQDVRALIDKGATSDEILKVGRRAKDRGLNVGPNVGNLFSELMG